eukprot:s3138_g8.t1
MEKHRQESEEAKTGRKSEERRLDREKVRREKIRQEKVRREKKQVREKCGWFPQWPGNHLVLHHVKRTKSSPTLRQRLPPLQPSPHLCRM